MGELRRSLLRELRRSLLRESRRSKTHGGGGGGEAVWRGSGEAVNSLSSHALMCIGPAKFFQELQIGSNSDAVHLLTRWNSEGNASFLFRVTKASAARRLKLEFFFVLTMFEADPYSSGKTTWNWSGRCFFSGI